MLFRFQQCFQKFESLNAENCDYFSKVMSVKIFLSVEILLFSRAKNVANEQSRNYGSVFNLHS